MSPGPVLWWSAEPVAVAGAVDLGSGLALLPSSNGLWSDGPGGRHYMDVRGSGVLDGRMVTRPEDARAVLGEVPAPTMTRFSGFGTRIRGPLVLMFAWPGGFAVLPDPLGSGFTYRYASPRLTAVSSDLDALVAFLRCVGVVPAKNLAYVAENIATGRGGVFSASYEGIEALPAFGYVLAVEGGIRVGSYDARDEVLGYRTRDGSLGPAWEGAYQDLLANARAAGAYGSPDHVSHLTGGFDSRLTLAALLRAGVAEQYTYYCSGNPQLPDRWTAERLSASYGLTLSDDPGFTELARPTSLADSFLTPQLNTAGMLIAGGPSSRRYAAPRAVVLSGCYGEIFRGSFSLRYRGRVVGEPPRTIAQTLWGNVVFPDDAQESLLSENLQGLYLDGFRRQLEAGHAAGLRDDSVLDWFYATAKNRYFIGLTSYAWSAHAHRMDPLYSLEAVKLMLSAPPEVKRSNIMGFDLMDRLAPGLREYPFDTDRYNDAYRSLRGETSRRAFDESIAPHIADYHPPQPTGGFRRPAATAEQVEFAKLRKANLWQVVSLEPVRELCREMLAGIPARERNAIFGRKVLNRLMTKNLTNRTQIRTVYNLYSGLLWFYDER